MLSFNFCRIFPIRLILNVALDCSFSLLHTYTPYFLLFWRCASSRFYCSRDCLRFNLLVRVVNCCYYLNYLKNHPNFLSFHPPRNRAHSIRSKYLLLFSFIALILLGWNVFASSYAPPLLLCTLPLSVAVYTQIDDDDDNRQRWQEWECGGECVQLFLLCVMRLLCYVFLLPSRVLCTYECATPLVASECSANSAITNFAIHTKIKACNQHNFLSFVRSLSRFLSRSRSSTLAPGSNG